MAEGSAEVPTTIDDALTPDDAGKVVEELLDAQNKSFVLGLRLNLPTCEVEAIHSKHADPRSSLLHVIIAFLRQAEPRPTWKALADALKSRMVNLPALAMKLERAYLSTSKQNEPAVKDKMVIGFTYHNIELYKSESLGSGSYGGVCKAKCDGLLCAAKIMHPTLFDPRDPGTASYLRKFQEECHLLSLARHPNVVQYLGTYTDPDTRLLVLLMELCDESLTSFLERSPGPLSYHLQVNICHDIALALVYLHSNGLIHRDLTGNNILMIAGTRAKITDFGMSKLATVNPRMTAFTTCPGNAFYMAPEALDEAPSYTTKLDIFSFGVIVIQILTRLFPNPTDRFRCIMEEVHGEVRVLVPEAERRWSHLSLIPDTHSMKPPTLHCLKKKENERPSALELSEILCDLKQSPKYSESVAVHREDLHATNEDNKELQQTKRELDHYKQLVSEFQQSLKRKDETITDLQNTVLIQKRRIQQLDQQNTASGAQQQDQPVTMPQTTAQRDISKMRWREGKNAPEAMSRGAAVVHGNTVYLRSAETTSFTHTRVF